MNFDNFRATQHFVCGHNPAYIMYVAPPLLYSDLSVLSLLPNDVVGPCVTTLQEMSTLCTYEGFTKQLVINIQRLKEGLKNWVT